MSDCGMFRGCEDAGLRGCVAARLPERTGIFWKRLIGAGERPIGTLGYRV
jgi:hypothetical protein